MGPLQSVSRGTFQVLLGYKTNDTEHWVEIWVEILVSFEIRRLPSPIPSPLRHLPLRRLSHPVRALPTSIGLLPTPFICSPYPDHPIPLPRLLVVNQERSQLKARSAAAAGAAGGGETPAVEAMVEAKKVVIAQLQEKVDSIATQVNSVICCSPVFKTVVLSKWCYLPCYIRW